MSKDEKKSTEFEFRGHSKLSYPYIPHPERPGVLQVEPNEIVDFGDASPPGDGMWYDVSSGDVFLPPLPSVEDAAPAQADAEDPED